MEHVLHIGRDDKVENYDWLQSLWSLNVFSYLDILNLLWCIILIHLQSYISNFLIGAII